MSSPLALPIAPSADTTKQVLDLLQVYDGVTSALLVLTTIAVTLRVFVRAKVTKTFGWDDIAMTAGQIMFYVTSALSLVWSYAAKLMVGENKLIMNNHALVQVIRFSNAAYSVTMILVKISIAIFFLKLFATSFKWQRILIISLTAISTAMGLAYLIFTIVSCGIMVQSQVSTPLHTGSDWCPSQQAFVSFSISWSIMNAVVDVIFAIMAITVICGAKMTRGTKITASILICLGCVGGVASIVRVFVQLPLSDIRLSGVSLGIWSNIEAGMCITAASLITLRPLYQSAIEKARLSFGSLKTSSIFSKDTKRSNSTTSSKKEVLSLSDLESQSSKSRVVVTRTWTMLSKDNEDVV